MPLTENGGYGVPREIVLPTSTNTLLGDNEACPNQPKEYLRQIYGDFGGVVYTYVDAAAAKTRLARSVGSTSVDRRIHCQTLSTPYSMDRCACQP